VSEWGTIFLGVIALAVSIMAAIQVGIVVYGQRLARRVDALATQVDRDIKPLLAHLTTIGEEAARASSLAAAQVERVDREGMALFAGVRAAFEAVRGLRRPGAPARSTAHDEDDPLFIG
jgi:hypothetical protein